MFKKVKLSDIGEVISGGTPKTKIEEYWNGNIPWITPKDLSNHTSIYISKGERYISEEGLNNSSAKKMPKGTVLFTSRAPIGYIAIANNEVTTNQGFKSIIVNEKNNNFFVYYLLKNNISLIENMANGSTFKEISGSVMKNIEFTIPSLEEQKAIAHILLSLDEKIENNNQINKKLEEMAQAIFKQWFVDFEFPNKNGESYKSSGGEMVESELGMIPKGWEVETLNKIGIFKNGKGIKEELRDEKGKNLIFGSNGVIGKTNEILQCNECIIIGRVGAYCGSIQISLQQCWITDNAIIATPTEDIYLPYLHRILLNSSLGDLAGGSAQPLINQGILNNIKTILPASSLIRRYYILAFRFMQKIESNIEQNNKLAELRDTLLPKLMSGEIRVPLE